MENPEVCFTVHVVSVDSLIIDEALIVSSIFRSYLVLSGTTGSAGSFSAFHPDF